MRVHALALLSFAMLLPAQERAEPFGHSRHGAEFDEGPRQSAYLMEGMSAQVHFPVAGLSTEAQRFFDQGVCQQHGFWYFEAERSFRQVAKLQPGCAMAYWGMAMANVENAQRAAGFIANAVERSAQAGREQQLWIDAIASCYLIDEPCRKELQSGDAVRVAKAKTELVARNKTREKEQKQKLERQLLKDLGTIVHEFPADIEAKAFLAVQIWRAWEWGQGIEIVSHTAVDALLDQVFAKAPLHPAHHYRIHLWDREKAERALRSAASNGDSAPGIAHQWHMSGHVYDKLHRHAEGAWQQEASSRVDHAHMQRDRVMPFLIHNYAHNQEWFARSLSYVGRASEALAVAKNLAELPRHPKWNKLDDGGHIAGYARARLLSICEEHEMWQEAVELRERGFLEASEHVPTEAARLGLLGRALFRLRRLDEAERIATEASGLLVKARAQRAAAIDEAETKSLAAKETDEKTRNAIAEAGRQRTDGVKAVLDLQRELAAERLLATGDPKGALAELEALKDLPKGLLADAFVAAGQPDKAIELLEKEVKERPHRFATTLRLHLAYEAGGKPEHGTRREELEKLLLGDRFVFEETPLWKRSQRYKPGPGTRLAVPGDDEPLFPESEPAFAADFGPRPKLASLGPKHWRPFAAAGFDLPCADGGRRSLASQRGRPVLVVFYLGFGCLRCVQQLEALSPKARDWTAAGIEIVAIGDEPLATTQAHLAALGEKKFAFPLLADPDLAAFKAWRCFDDFESMPLHGTFLVDGEGRVRWQDISFEPFTQVDWLLAESQRLLALPAGAGSK
ncbi:MAG TPA: redoxin domain-containing protein [Planctomycetota bacterium]